MAASERDGQNLATEFKAQYEALVQEHAGTEAALTARLWLLQQIWWGQEAGTMQDSAGRIVDEILAVLLRWREHRPNRRLTPSPGFVIVRS